MTWYWRLRSPTTFFCKLEIQKKQGSEDEGDQWCLNTRQVNNNCPVWSLNYWPLWSNWTHYYRHLQKWCSTKYVGAPWFNQCDSTKPSQFVTRKGCCLYFIFFALHFNFAYTIGKPLFLWRTNRDFQFSTRDLNFYLIRVKLTCAAFGNN